METRPVEQGQPREELLELYKMALEDYRFQVQLNQGRSQYFLVLNIGIIGIATGIVQMASGPFAPLVALLYLVGALFSAFAIIALRLQRKYYKSARRQKKVFEDKLGLKDTSITPVARSSDGLGRLLTFKNSVDAMLAVMAVLNTFGVLFVLS